MRALAAVVFYFVSFAIGAQSCPTTGTVYRLTYNGSVLYEQWYAGPYTSENAMATCNAGYVTAGTVALQTFYQNNAVYTFSNHTPLAPTGLCSGPGEVTRTPVSGGAPQVVSTTWSVQPSSQTGQCPPPPPECDQDFPDIGERFTSSSYPGADGYCHALSHCKMRVGHSVDIGGNSVYNIEHTNESCTAGAPPPPPEDLEDGETCATSASGNEFCMTQQGENCGYVNGNFTCLEQIEQDGCKVFQDSSRVCGQEAPLPPVPDDGNPGHAAPPDDQLTTNTGDVFNYYNTTTVSNSNRDPGDSGDNPFDGDDGSGVTPGTDDGNGEDPGEDGSVSGGVSCGSPPVCSGDALECAAIEQQWRTRCVEMPSDSELQASFGPTLPEDPEGMIPEFQFSVPEALDSEGWIANTCPSDLVIDLGSLLGSVTIPISRWCEWLSIFGVMVMIASYLAGIRIILGGL